MNLRKICNHPYLLPGVDPTPHKTDQNLVEVCGKMKLLDKLLAMLKEQGSRALIFSQFVVMLDVLEDYLLMRGYKYCRLDGNSSYEMRASDMANFNKDNSDIFVYLLSTRQSGLGINLHTADTVIIYDSDWNPQADIQAEDRAHRIGQKKQVRVFRLISENTVDERIVQRAAIKLRLDRKVIQEGKLLQKDQLNKGQMSRFFNADKDYTLNCTKATIKDETILETIQRSQEKAKILEATVECSDINLDNFETVFKFDGKNYQKADQDLVTNFL
jgi:SWI/SNF-related matrix-associated actin-dependent regulator of chromatin subfamily A member 5